MTELKLEPDDVLTGAGTVREEAEVECPDCGGETVVEIDSDTGVCTACDSSLSLEKPF